LKSACFFFHDVKLVKHVKHVNIYLAQFLTGHTIQKMKGKTIAIRPSPEMRRRLERLVEATGHTLSFHVALAVESHLPQLEKRYARELAELDKKEPAETKRPKAA
jgi:predicted DNA-binding protein